jgi:hypothetical protein
MIKDSILQAMEAKDIKNVHQLAVLTNITESTLHRFFSGASIGSDKLDTIAAALGKEWKL